MNPQLELDEIERKVKSALDMIGERSRRWNHRKCTHEVLKAVGDLGEEHFRFVVASPDSRVGQDHEWLYDLCWCEEKDGFVKNLPLALESEWAQDFCAILDDFQKLVVSRAGHRILVCSQPFDDWANCVALLTEQIHRYSGTKDGDRYLFASWTTEGWQFTQYVHPAPINRPKHIWLFGANRDRYDLTKKLKQGRETWWDVKCYRDFWLRPGDSVVLWQSGAEAGIYGFGELTSEAYEHGDEWRADIRYEGLLKHPILKSDLRKHPLLKNLNVITMPRGRNPFRIYIDEWQALQDLLHSRAMPES